MTLSEKYVLICKNVEELLDEGVIKFGIYPFGENGILVEQILRDRYGITQITRFDNFLCKYRRDIFKISHVSDWENDKNSCLIVTIENGKLYDTILEELSKTIGKQKYICLFKKIRDCFENKYWIKHTEIGKYSGGSSLVYGDHPFIKSIGAFTSIAYGCEVVPNHPMEYISTHPFLYGTNRIGESEYEGEHEYEIFSNERWYFPGIKPQGHNYVKRITIGNDVWLGRNVIVTNYSNIGDGVIAGAGSIITKDVPDYAVVVGNPAKVIRYRYSQEQIVKLKRIAWWDWEDKKIIDCYDDFFLPIDLFIEKHYIGES